MLFARCIAMTCHSLGLVRVKQLLAAGAKGKMEMYKLAYDRLDEFRNMQLLYGCPGFS